MVSNGVKSSLAILLIPVLASSTAAETLQDYDEMKLQEVDDDPLSLLLVHERGTEFSLIQDGLDRRGFSYTTLENVGITQVLASAEDIRDLALIDGVQDIYQDETLQYYLDEAGPLVNANTTWEEHAVTGEGATVLVIDTGIDVLHPDLVDGVLENAQPHDPLETGLIPEGYMEGVPANDWFGHGTHVAGIVAGTGYSTGEMDPNHERYVGIAPGADLVGWAISGLEDGPTIFQAVQGFEYALEQQERFGIDVITNSWGLEGPPDPDHPINVASLEAYKAGMSVVFAAGNAGEPRAQGDVRLNTFSLVPWTLGVSALTSDANLAEFSSQGTAPKDADEVWNHPDIAAQGASVMASKSRMGAMQALGPLSEDSGAWDVIGQGTHYQYASGTSMSAPAVAGVLALMNSANPNLSPAQAYQILVETSQPLGDAYWEAGVGLADAYTAVNVSLDTIGERDEFLSRDEVAFTDVEDPLDHPVRSFLIDKADERGDASALLEALGTEYPRSSDDAVDVLEEEGNEARSPGLAALFLISLLALARRR